MDIIKPSFYVLESDTLHLNGTRYGIEPGYKVVYGIPGRCVLSHEELSHYGKTGKLLQEKDDEGKLYEKDD